MKRIFLLFAAFCWLSFSYAETLTRTFYFDFGMDGGTRGEITTSPDANGHYWNNIGNQSVSSNKPSLDVIYDLVDATNASTSVKVQLAGTKFTANGMSGGGGLLSPSAELLSDLAVATATEDYLFASNSEHCTIGISGLDPAKGYQFKVFASRVATDDRVSDYTFRGALAIQGSLQAAGNAIGANDENQNTSNVYLSPVMRPDAEGKISITVHRQFAGSGAYFPINCMRMQEMTDLHVADREIYIDCGHSDGTNGELTAAPDGNGIYWNNLYDPATSAAPVALTYRDGSVVNSGANVTITAAFQRNGYNNGGNTAATYSSLLGVFGQKSVAGDYFFVNKTTAKMRFNGLNPDKAYVFYIYGSRKYNSSFGQTVDKLKLEGLTTVNGTHHTGGNGMCYSGAADGWNEDAFTVMEPLFPDAEGRILLTLSDERGSYQHINGMRIEEYSDYQKPTPPAEPTYAALNMKGTAVEGGEVPMYLRAPDGVTEGTSFEAFCRLINGGTLSFETSENEVLSSGTCELADGIYRIVYNTTAKTFTSLAISRVGLVGNVTSAGWNAAGLEMTYQGNGVWQGTFDLVVYSGTDAERGEFCLNSSWDYEIKARNGVEGVAGFELDQEDCEFTVSDIPMRHGRKVVTLNLRNFTYSLECVDVADNKITFFGSSVCNGQGASEEGNIKHGYAWQYGQLLTARHAADNTLPEYEYSNASINGNNTMNLLARYKGHMLGDCGEYVVIGLGLGNEGIHGAANLQAIYNQWKTNMQTLIGYGEAAGKVMVATNNYPRGDYNATDYGYVKAMNLEMHEWTVPTVNFLGALDNCQGNGQWASGYQNGDDVYHPTEAGHTEFMHAIVPSLFDALEVGKAKPTRQTGEGIVLSADKKIVLTPEEQVHAFSLAFRVKNISALNLNWTLSAGTAPVVASALSDANWHTVFVSHYYAAGKTYVYIDGTQQSVSNGQLLLTELELSGACSISDLHFWRSGMNADEVAAFEAGKMLCSSLELYCPLNNNNVTNLAQSTNAIQLIEPTTYYIAGNCEAMGSWSPNTVALTAGQITFTNLAADWYEFKITDGAWSNNGGTEWGYSELDVSKSSPMHKTYDYNNNICFRLQAAADVTVKMENNKVVLLIDREYCITGNKELVGGDGWTATTDKTLTQTNNYAYTFYNLPVGDYRFKVKENVDGAWHGDCTWGYDHLDTGHSNAGGDWDGDDHNIGFHLDAPADVTIAIVNNQIRLNTKPVYFVTGDLGSNGWVPADEDRRLDPETNAITFSNVAAGTYRFMLTNGTWDLKLNYDNVDKATSSNGVFNNGGDDKNIKITLDQTANVTIVLDPSTSKITLTSSVGYFSCSKYSVVGWGLFAGDWEPSDTETEMTAMGDGTYQYILHDKELTAAEYGFRVVGEHSWDVQYPISSVTEPRVTIPESGTYTIIFSFNPADAAPSYELEYPATDVAISAYQFSSFYSNKAYELPAGLQAFIYTGIDGDILVMESINPIPAETGVILYGAANQTYSLAQTTTDVSYPANLLKGTLTDQTINNSMVHYILSLNSASEFGLFWPAGTSEGVGSFTNHAGKAYLELDPGTAKNVKGFVLRGTTAIEDVAAPMTDDQWYDLLGRPVDKPTQSGIYIRQGKKVVVL